MTKLISVDLDGTLLSPDGRLAPGAPQAIAKARAAGMRVVLNTGRPLTETGTFARQAGCDSLVSCLGGALVADTGTGQVLFQRDIPQPWGYRAAELCLGSGPMQLCIFSGNQVVLNPYSKASLLKTYPYPEFHRRAVVTEDPLAYLEEHRMPVTKLHGDWGVFPLEELAALPGAQLTSSSDHDFELVPQGVDKGTALAYIARHYGIPLAECAAVGDSENDLPMLAAAGLALAMGNADPRVKAAADFTVSSNAAGGAVEAILHCLER